MKKAALLAVPLLLVSCSSGSGKSTGDVSTSGSPEAQTVTVDMKNDLKFHPNTIKAKVGTVTFDVKNVETVPHDFTFKDDSLGHTKLVDGGKDENLKVTFSKAGTFTFTCTVHPGMDGKVIVS